MQVPFGLLCGPGLFSKGRLEAITEEYCSLVADPDQTLWLGQSTAETTKKKAFFMFLVRWQTDAEGLIIHETQTDPFWEMSLWLKQFSSQNVHPTGGDGLCMLETNWRRQHLMKTWRGFKSSSKSVQESTETIRNVLVRVFMCGSGFLWVKTTSWRKTHPSN